MNSKELGAAGEKIAEKYLKEKGYRILDRNYVPRFISGPLRAEIDLIAKKDGVIIFVEVKAIANNGFPVSPEEKVNFQKQRKIIKAAESWLMKNKIPLEVKWQIDVVSIRIDSESKKAKIRHFENAVI